GGWEAGRVLQAAYEYKSPIKAIQGVPYNGGQLPSTGSYFTVSPAEKVMLSGLKLAENGEGVVLRVWNCTDKELDLKLDTIMPVKGAARLRMDETFIENLVWKDKGFEYKLGAHKVETFLLKK
ncbi:MAG: glycosyl hydrolase-related protein, partial [Christensenellales bacterium]